MRPPDQIIGPRDAPQTFRWNLLKWRGLQIALHRWQNSDSDRALHDHTADNISILLTGSYRECFSHSWEPEHTVLRLPFIPYFRKAEQAHRVILHRGPVWTLWIRFAPRREWGFHCRNGWRHWRDYVDKRDIGLVGKGCDS